MEWNWKGRNVDLAMLTTRVGDFFKDKDFEAIKGKTRKGYQILAENSPYFKLLGYVSVTIEGEPNDFVVKLDLCGKKRNNTILTHFKLLTMFGGGYLFMQELRSNEAWIKLKREFQQHLENVVLQLTNSSNVSNKPE